MSIKEENLRNLLKATNPHPPRGLGSREYPYSIPADHRCKESEINSGQQGNHGRGHKEPEY